MFRHYSVGKALSFLFLMTVLFIAVCPGHSSLEAGSSSFEATSEDGAEILILLNEQADTAEAALTAKKAQGLSADTQQQKLAIRSKVVETLQEIATASQPSLLRYLEQEKTAGRVTEIKTFYIVNVVYARVSEELAETIA